MRKNIGIGPTMDEYKRVEKELLAAWGHHDVRLIDTGVNGVHKWARVGELTNQVRQIFPAYVRDDGDCFKLMQIYDIWTIKDEQVVGNIRHNIVAAWWKAPDGFTDRVYTRLDEHQEVGYAYRYAVALAVIAKLKQYQEFDKNKLGESAQRTA